MDNLKKDYTDDVMNLVESFLKYQLSEREFVDRVREYLLLAAEIVYEKHEDNE